MTRQDHRDDGDEVALGSGVGVQRRGRHAADQRTAVDLLQVLAERHHGVFGLGGVRGVVQRRVDQDLPVPDCRGSRGAARGAGDDRDAAFGQQVGVPDAVAGLELRQHLLGVCLVGHDHRGAAGPGVEVPAQGILPVDGIGGGEDDVGLGDAVGLELQDAGGGHQEQQHRGDPDRARPAGYERTGGPPEPLLALEAGDQFRFPLGFREQLGPERPERGPAQQCHQGRQQGQGGEERAEDARRRHRAEGLVGVEVGEQQAEQGDDYGGAGGQDRFPGRLPCGERRRPSGWWCGSGLRGTGPRTAGRSRWRRRSPGWTGCPGSGRSAGSSRPWPCRTPAGWRRTARRPR